MYTDLNVSKEGNHQQTHHFAGFGARVGDMVEEKTARTWERVGGARGA
jgi:hypothetical protein